MERVKEREGVISRKVDLFGLCGGVSAPVTPTLPTGLDPLLLILLEQK